MQKPNQISSAISSIKQNRFFKLSKILQHVNLILPVRQKSVSLRPKMSDKWETVGKPAKVVKGKGNGAVSNNNKKVCVCVVCPRSLDPYSNLLLCVTRSSDPFYIVTYYMKWLTIAYFLDTQYCMSIEKS